MAGARHLVLLVEEPSMEAFLQSLLPRALPAGRTFEVHPFQGKPDLMSKLEGRLRGFAHWLPEDWRLVVVVDRDDDDCKALKARMEAVTTRAGLMSRTRCLADGARDWQLANRIAVEELEAWYFGDWTAVRGAYPRVPVTLASRRGFRHPDDIASGTWEAFERVLQRHGYFSAGLGKIEAARATGEHAAPARNGSPSFQVFHAALMEAVS